MGLWFPSIYILIPTGFVVVMGIGYASLATMSLPIIGSAILFYRYLRFGSPWIYATFGLLAELFIIWALRSNIKRLINGTERIVGIRAKKRSRPS